MRRPSFLLLLPVLALAPLLHTGCVPQVVMPFTAEADDPDYRRGKELLRMGREQEALAQFLRLIDQRGGAAAESHLEVGILYHKHIKDPIAAIYHYRRYRELRPGTEQARLVLQSIEACVRDFARTLPAQPLDNQVERTDLMEAIDRLQRENLQLKEQLAGARAAVLDTTRQAAAGEGLAVTPGFGIEPSQGGYVADAPSTGLATRGTGPEYAVPVEVTPVPVVPVPLPAPAPAVQAVTPPAASAPTAGVRRHVVAKGDTLQLISLRYYGTRSRFRDIYAANRDVMPNEGTLRIGMELKIPQ